MCRNFPSRVYDSLIPMRFELDLWLFRCFQCLGKRGAGFVVKVHALLVIDADK